MPDVPIMQNFGIRKRFISQESCNFDNGFMIICFLRCLDFNCFFFQICHQSTLNNKHFQNVRKSRMITSTRHLTLTLIFIITISVRCNFYNGPLHLANDALYGEREFVNISGDIKLGALVAIYDAGGQVSKRCNASGKIVFETKTALFYDTTLYY